MRRRGFSSNAAVRWGLGTVLVAVLATYLGFAKDLPGGGGFELKAAFRSANDVKPGSFVRIGGVNVGRVTAVEPLRPGADAAVVTMELEDKGLPVHRDATLKVRPRIFLEGNFFVDLQPGSPSAPEVGEGEVLPVTQTAAPVQIDQVLGALRADTREGLREVLDGLAGGLRGSGARGYRDSIRHWERAYRDGAIAADASTGLERDDLPDYVREAGAVADALDRDPRALQALLEDFSTTATAFASEDVALGRAIGELPRTLRAAQPALGALNRAFGPLRELVADLRPAVRSSRPAIRASRPFVAQLRDLVGRGELRGLVADLRPVVPALAAATRATLPLYEQVSLASNCQNEVILPWTEDRIEDKTFPATGKVFEEATKFLPGIAGESRSGDANGQWFRTLVGYGNFAADLGTDQVFLTSAPLIGTNPPKPQRRTPLRPDVPCETQQAPDLRTVPGAAPASHRISVPADRRDELAKVTRRTVREVNRTIRASGLGKRLKAVTEPLTREGLAKLQRIARTAKEAGR